MPEATPPDIPALLAGRRRILVTGGAGFIGGAMVRRLLTGSEALVFNLDKMGYASDLTSIEALPQAAERHQLLQVDLTDAEATAAAVKAADPDLVLHLAAESHVDRSIEGPDAFIASNVSGTFHLLQAVRAHWEQLPGERQAGFRFHHISTDEVFGSLGETGRFSETTPYDPRSPYSASKAASDHLVNAWHYTYGLWMPCCWRQPRGSWAAAAARMGSPQPPDHAGDGSAWPLPPGQPRHSFQAGLAATVRWYLDHQDWCNQVRQLSGYPVNANATPSSLVAQRATFGLMRLVVDPGFPAQGAAAVFRNCSTAGIQASLARKLRLQLAALHSATQIEDMDLPGYRLHQLKGADKGRWSIWVNGNWRLTFAFRDGHVFDLDFEDDH